MTITKNVFSENGPILTLFYKICFPCLCLILVIALINDTIHGYYVFDLVNIPYAISAIVFFVLWILKKISSKLALSSIIYGELISYQFSIFAIAILSMNNLYETAFVLSLQNAIMSFALCVVINKNVGFACVSISAVDVIIIKLIQNEPHVIFYVFSFPLILIAVGFTIMIFRGSLDEYIIKLYGSKGPKPKLDLRKLGITFPEYRCILFLREFKATKEIAAIEGCSDSAIQGRIGSIFTKLKVLDRPSLMYVLGQNDLVWNEEKENNV